MLVTYDVWSDMIDADEQLVFVVLLISLVTTTVDVNRKQ